MKYSTEKAMACVENIAQGDFEKKNNNNKHNWLTVSHKHLPTGFLVFVFKHSHRLAVIRCFINTGLRVATRLSSFLFMFYALSLELNHFFCLSFMKIGPWPLHAREKSAQAYSWQKNRFIQTFSPHNKQSTWVGWHLLECFRNFINRFTLLIQQPATADQSD